MTLPIQTKQVWPILILINFIVCFKRRKMIKIILYFCDVLVPETENVIENVMINIFLTENAFHIFSTSYSRIIFFDNGIINIFQIC